jgi:NADH/F420H2 dehydrogenase subunit C
MEWLRDDEGNRFDYLSCVTAVDWTEREPRFDVVYHLRSLEKNHCLTVKVGCEDGGGVPSVVEVWKTADWLERETYDLYGVEFLGHPNLERIFLPEDWVGHPLRKDYPLEGPNLELLTRQQAAFRGGRFDRIRGDYEMTEQERQMAGPGVVGPLWTPKPEAPPEAAESDEPSED